ncbi:polysaccharide deacetylase family protein [Bacillus songklensis]|uniref:Polysaccharide deacetylase family protein n=1 Tax=Bacillus songklensis TaxID=1069116 RepID=A0ABV8B4N1_9BACI
MGFNNLHPIEYVNTPNKYVALTFDDGPDPIYTDKILDILGKYNAKATFFMVGKHVDLHYTVAKKVKLSGHEIGNHTFNHPNLKEINRKEIRRELKLTDKILKRLTKNKCNLFRPPFGSYHDEALKIADKMGYKTILWTKSLDTRDWKKNRSWAQIYALVIDNIKPGSIVLFHDSSNNGNGDRSETVTALEKIIIQLTKENYQFVTVSELLEKQKQKQKKKRPITRLL